MFKKKKDKLVTFRQFSSAYNPLIHGGGRCTLGFCPFFVADAHMEKQNQQNLVSPPLRALWNMGLKTTHGWEGLEYKLIHTNLFIYWFLYTHITPTLIISFAIHIHFIQLDPDPLIFKGIWNQLKTNTLLPANKQIFRKYLHN